MYELENVECTKCGVCCFSQSPDYLRVAGVDRARLAEDAERLTVSIDGNTYMRLRDGHCVALVFEAQSSRFLCSIYQRRPDVCRWLEPGSGHCASQRSEKRDRTLVLLGRKPQQA